MPSANFRKFLERLYNFFGQRDTSCPRSVGQSVEVPIHRQTKLRPKVGSRVEGPYYRVFSVFSVVSAQRTAVTMSPWWQWSPRAWSWAGAAQDSAQHQPQQWSAASWSWAAAAQDRTLTPRRSSDGPDGAAGPTGAWARYQGGTASAPQTTERHAQPGQGANRAKRVGHPTRLLRNYVRVMWRKVQDEYQDCLKNAEIFDVQSWAEKFLSYQAYLERHGKDHQASSNLGHTPPRTLSVGECSEHSWAATAPTGNSPIQQFTHMIMGELPVGAVAGPRNSPWRMFGTFSSGQCSRWGAWVALKGEGRHRALPGAGGEGLPVDRGGARVAGDRERPQRHALWPRALRALHRLCEDYRPVERRGSQ